MKDDLLGESVLAMKRDGLRVMGMEEGKGVNDWVCIAKESPYVMSVIVGDILEAMGGHLTIFLYHCFCNDKFLHTILARVLEDLFSHHTMFAHGVAHLEGWVDEDSVYSTQHLSIHSTHGGADDEMRFMGADHLLEHCHCFRGIDRDILGNDISAREECLEDFHCVGGCGRTESVDIHNGLVDHEVGIGFDILVFHKGV